MITLFPAKCCDEILHCSSDVWAGVVMNHRNTPAKYAMSLILDRVSQFFKCVSTDTCVDCGALSKKSTSRKPFLYQNIVHMMLRVEVVCLNFLFVGNETCLQSINCCFNSGVSCHTHVSSPVTTRLEKFSPFSTYHIRKSNLLACCFNLCSSVSIFSTQFAHNFVK